MSNATPQQDPTPYATAASIYWQAGWRGILPLPPKRKANPPDGYTGNGGIWPSYPDVYAWTEQKPTGNICLRLPPDVVGVDVDHYGDKIGGDTLTRLEAELGPLPATWRVTSRDDGISGIRLFRVPVGLRWPSVYGKGIEVIREGHRYAVVWPSIHPDTGGTYRWIDPNGVDVIGVVPDPATLPDLPQTWIDHFTSGQLATDQARANMAAPAINEWLQRRGVGIPCKHMQTAISRGVQDIRSGQSRHDAALAVTNRLTWLAGEGHPGAYEGLGVIYQTFSQAVAGDRAPGDAEAEWWRMIDGAVKMAAAAHPQASSDPCLDPFRGLIAPSLPKGPDTWTSGPTASTTPTGTTTTGSPGGSLGPYTAPPSTPSAGYAGMPPAGTSMAPAVGATAGSSAPPPQSYSGPSTGTTDNGTQGIIPPGQPTTELPAFDPYADIRARFRPGGSFILDIPDKVPALWGKGDDVLWADGEALTICGPAGVGKTTLCGQVVRARIIGGDVLGLPVVPTEGRVLYLAMDRPRQIARALRRTLGNVPRDILDSKLVIWPGPPIADVALRPETLLGLCQLAGADTVIIDSIKDAAVGLSNDEVGAGYNRARQMCIAAGVQVLELHHMVKRGDQGAKPTSLNDLYGSVWIGAGSGSVMLLFGVGGDPIVQMSHLKQPADEVGPWRLLHDHQRGETTIFHQADLVAIAKATGSLGITAKQAASSIAEKDNPSASEIEKARRRLDRLVDQGRLLRMGGSRGGSAGSAPATYTWLSDDPDGTQGIVPQSNHEPNTGRDWSGPVTEAGSNHGDTPSEHEKAVTEPNTAVTHQSNHVPTPLSIGGGTGAGGLVERSIAGKRVLFDPKTKVMYDPDTGEIVS